MAMAVKSFNSGIGPECWPTSTVGWDHEWEWQEEEETVKDEPVVVGTPAASFFFSLESPASPVVAAAAAATTTTTKSKSSSTSLKLGRSSPQDSLSPPPPPSKKQRPMSPPTTLVPRCQVENCKADLSGCKDYHKRHKVCEMHSKAPKAIANGIEQRFCQQCSRFHLLKEFDEGKRSCRRRLAGHNERRRKPHPEPHSFFQLSNAGFLHREISTSTLSGVGSPFYSLLSPSPEDIKPSSLLHPHRGSFLNTLDSYTSATNSFSFKNRNDIIPTFQIQNPKTPMTILKPTSGLNLGGHDHQQHRHHYLDHDSTTSSLGPLGQGLSLSPSTGRVQVQSLDQSQQQSSFNSSSSSAAAMDSGRALSLLSSQPWAPTPRPPAPHHDSTTLEHLVASSTSSSHESSNFTVSPSYGAGGGLHFSNGLTATGSSGTHHINNINSSNNMLSSLGGYDASSMLALLQGGGGGHSSLGGLTTMDLINHGGYNSGSSFNSVRAFESSRFGHQQQLL